HPGSVNEFDF
nr:Chain E, Dense granule protein 6, HF10 peptide [Toxoplasma gondii]